MSKKLSALLDAREPLFSAAIDELERASGRPGADVRLTAEIIGKTHLSMRELGLDPNDTTGRELYQALLGLIGRHDTFLAKKIGATDPESAADLLPRIKKAAEKAPVPRQAWVMKTSVAKRLLKAKPPKKLMAQLGYRSIDSMLKRESVAELYGALRFFESTSWLNSFIESYKKLTPTDFETRDIKVLLLDKTRWSPLTEKFVKQTGQNLTHLKELGFILILPLPIDRLRGLTVAVLPRILHYYNEIRLYSTYFKLQQVRRDFGSIIVRTLVDDPSQHATMASNSVHWRVIQRYFGKRSDKYNPELFEPHVQPDDVAWNSAEDALFKIEPALHFWHDMDYVALKMDERPISFNLMDVAVSYANQLPYGSQSVQYMRNSLYSELFIRYLSQSSLEHQVLSQLDNGMIAPERLVLSQKLKQG